MCHLNFDRVSPDDIWWTRTLFPITNLEIQSRTFKPTDVTCQNPELTQRYLKDNRMLESSSQDLELHVVLIGDCLPLWWMIFSCTSRLTLMFRIFSRCEMKTLLMRPVRFNMGSRDYIRPCRGLIECHQKSQSVSVLSIYAYKPQFAVPHISLFSILIWHSVIKNIMEYNKAVRNNNYS